MSPSEIPQVLETIVRKHARFPIDAVAPASSLGSDCGLDSLAMVMALAEVEERLEIRFPIERVEHVRELTFGQLTALVIETRAHGRNA